jgi:CheY-like chemotaxis protein/serine/threonine protein phosphatase PrpC
MTASNDLAKAPKGFALVVDDVAANRIILQGLLTLEGYRTIQAENGQQAVQLYAEHLPDIVFMDVMMPIMNGYEATMQIKSLTKSHFIPVIFLTALNESDAMVKCIEAGGDDFLGKPFKQEILRAKIKAMERIRDMSRIIVRQNQELERQHNLLLKEQIVAEEIYNRAVTEDNVASKYISSQLRAVSVFSGDMVLTAYCPDGKLHIMLGDFTGHGIAAAVGVLPSAEVFRTMTTKGFSAAAILISINSKLNRLLPTGKFLTACFVVIEPDMKRACIWNMGMPDVLILGAGKNKSHVLKHKVSSQYLPLGILAEIDVEVVPVCEEICEGDRILLCSDGVSDALNANNERFGLQRYEQAAIAAEQSFDSVIAALENFCAGHPYSDDVSLVEIHCMPGLVKFKSANQSMLAPCNAE